MKKPSFIPLALFVVLVGFLAVGLGLDPREVPSPLVNKPAPAFKLTQLDDAEKKFRTGRYVGQSLGPQRVGIPVRCLQRRSIRCWWTLLVRVWRP